MDFLVSYIQLYQNITHYSNTVTGFLKSLQKSANRKIGRYGLDEIRFAHGRSREGERPREPRQICERPRWEGEHPREPELKN
jgi:hypothetical protein